MILGSRSRFVPREMGGSQQGAGRIEIMAFYRSVVFIKIFIQTDIAESYCDE